MFEKRLAAVPWQLFTSDGSPNGVVQVQDASYFRTDQIVLVSATSLPTLELVVKKVISSTQLVLGFPNTPPYKYADLSAYTVVLGAQICSNEQSRIPMVVDNITRAEYEEEPVVAKRVILVDKLGNKYDQNNPLFVNVSAGTSTSYPGLNVSHAEITNVAANTEISIITITPAQDLRVKKIEVSGDNIAHFKVKVDNQVVGNKRSWWTAFNQTFNFEDFQYGLMVATGRILTVTVEHSRPSLGNFEATVMAI